MQASRCSDLKVRPDHSRNDGFILEHDNSWPIFIEEEGVMSLRSSAFQLLKEMFDNCKQRLRNYPLSSNGISTKIFSNLVYQNLKIQIAYVLYLSKSLSSVNLNIKLFNFLTGMVLSLYWKIISSSKFDHKHRYTNCNLIY